MNLIVSGKSTENMAIISYISLSKACRNCHSNDLAVNKSKTTQMAVERRSGVPSIPEAKLQGLSS